MIPGISKTEDFIEIRSVQYLLNYRDCSSFTVKKETLTLKLTSARSFMNDFKPHSPTRSHSLTQDSLNFKSQTTRESHKTSDRRMGLELRTLIISTFAVVRFRC